MNENKEKFNKYENYSLPSINILKKSNMNLQVNIELLATAEKLKQVLKSFKIDVVIEDIIPGPVVTRYDVILAPGTTFQDLKNIADDIPFAMKTASIRVDSIPEKSVIGIEIPNSEISHVNLRNILDTDEFRKSKSLLTWAVGTKTDGSAYITSLDTMPHLLIVGNNNTEIKTCIDNIILSILYKAKPNEVKFMLIDTKKEMSVYKNMPHLSKLSCMESKTNADIFSSLKKLVDIMEERYEKYASSMVRNIKEYNEKIIKENKDFYIVSIINNLEDLIMISSEKSEKFIQKLAQMGRAVGIHLIIATQTPDEYVITENIKCNFPARLSFNVNSVDISNRILSCEGAEKLVGNGDMLFITPSKPKPIRLQCAFVSHEEIEQVINFINSQNFQKEDNKTNFYDSIFKDEKLLEVITDKISSKLLDIISKKIYNKLEKNQKAIEKANNTINLSKQISNKLFDNYNLIKKEKGENILNELIKTVTNIAINANVYFKEMEKINIDLTNIDTNNTDKIDLVFIIDNVCKNIEHINSNSIIDYEKLKQIDKEIDDLIKKQ